MLKIEPKQLSLHSTLYNMIPENHILKRINAVVDFSFINKLLEDSYCKDFGRPAKIPEMMIKLLLLQKLYGFSDTQVIENATFNLLYKWFIGLNPEDDLPDPSLLAKFRTQRLKELTLDDIIMEVVHQCVDKGIIKGTELSVDCTHIEANTKRLVPERLMKKLAQKIFKSLKKELGEVPEDINQHIPEYTQIEDHKQARETMISYMEELTEKAENHIDSKKDVETQEAIDTAKEILADPKFIEQKGVRSLVDKDARVGYKTKTDSFFGFKAETAMLVDSGIITGINVYSGEYVDGTYFESLYERTKKCGIEIKKAYGDKAYFRRPIIDLLEKEKVKAYIAVSQSVYKMDEGRFSYNKDSDQWFCMMGNYTVTVKSVKRKNRKKEEYKSLRYYFEKEKCRNCPRRKECIKDKTIAKILEISENTPKFYEYSQWEKTEEFKQEYKKRARHEGKHGEMKLFHGLDRAKGYGLKSVQTQAKLIVLAVNLKRIAHLVSSYLLKKRAKLPICGCRFEKRLNFIAKVALKSALFQWSRTVLCPAP